MTYACQYCKKTFIKESTLAAHLCEPKRRYQQQTETGVQLGFKSYLRFYESTQGSAKLKTYDNFVSSPYYGAFVKYGRYLVAIRAVNAASYTDWLLKTNKKLDYWTKDSYYLEWLQEYIKKEATSDALERALKEMQNYADTEPGLGDSFTNYFTQGSANRICYHIANGRLSPWIVFNCKTGVDWLSTLNDDQIKIIMPWIEPDFWQRKFKDYVADTEWIKDILAKAGL